MAVGAAVAKRVFLHEQDEGLAMVFSSDLVRRASLSHLLAVSGMNLAAVVAMAWCLAWLAGLCLPRLYLHLPRPKLTALLGLPLTLAYLWLSGFEPSLMRAALMFASWGVLVLLGRQRVLLDGLFFALAAMLLFDPFAAFELGLLLSASAVAGLLFLMPLAQPLLSRLKGLGVGGRCAAVVAGWAAVTLSAQMGVLPVQAQVFGEASWHLYLNLLWVPVVEWLAQPPAYVGALLICWLPALGKPLLGFSADVCALMLTSLQAMDARGLLVVHPVLRPWWPEVLGYLALAGGLAYTRRMSPGRAGAWLGICLALLGAPTVWRAWED